MDEPPTNDDPPAGGKLPRNVKVLGWASLFNDIAGEMVYPLLPQFLITVLGGNKTWLGVIDGTAESVSSIVKLWSGRRSDRDGGRKGFVVFGYALAALTRPLAAVIAWPWQLFGIRVADRIGKGIRTPPRDALIADSTSPDARGWAFGFHQAMDHVGAAIGPLGAAAFLWFWPNAPLCPIAREGAPRGQHAAVLGALHRGVEVGISAKLDADAHPVAPHGTDPSADGQ